VCVGAFYVERYAGLQSGIPLHTEHVSAFTWNIKRMYFGHEFRVHADTHKFNIRLNISTDTIYITENPLKYKCTYPTKYNLPVFIYKNL
jgi:hypothetical protein